METIPPKTSVANPGALRAIVIAGFVAGSLDITAACVQYYIVTGKDPVNVLRFVASGAFGKPALSGGPAVALWGLVLHFMCAFAFTFFFFLIYPRLKIMAKNKWITAVVYGIFVWCVMNLLVVPNSQAPKITFHPDKALIAAAILICMIGLPITFIIGNYFSKKEV